MAATSADHLRREIQLILKDADLNTLSSKKVRLILEGLFKCDFSERKKEIDDILMSEITARDVLPIPAARTSEQVDRDDQRRVERTDADRSSSSGQTQRPSQESVNAHGDQQITKSDEAIAMEIHQQENRPSLRRTANPTSAAPTKRRSGPSLTIERRQTLYNKELDLSDQLAVVVGGHRMPRSEVVKRMWVYFKEHKLLDPHNRQYINCDDTLAKLFGRKRVRAFGMLKGLSPHMSDPDKQ